LWVEEEREKICDEEIEDGRRKRGKKTERNKPQRKRKEGFLFYLSIYLFERGKARPSFKYYRFPLHALGFYFICPLSPGLGILMWHYR